MTLGKFLRGFIAGAALLSSAVTGQAQARAPQGPALWKVVDKDTIIYLFGTIHTLPEKAEWRTGPVAKAIDASDSLVLEIVMDDPARSAQLLATLGVTPGQQPLAERIPTEKKDELQQLVAASGLPPAFTDQLESWAAAITLANVAFLLAGFSPDRGMEAQLTQIYRDAQKPIGALETVEQQLGFLDSLSEKAQRALLAGSVEDPKTIKTALDAMLGAWLGGDVKAIAQTFDQETKSSPELQQALLLRRNQVWTQWVADRLKRPGTVFVAVGAGHLAGADSLQTMLSKRGIRSQRIN